MNQITESLYAEKFAELQAAVEDRERVIVALVFQAGHGKNVAIPKGVIRQAAKTVERVEWRMLSSGELRIEVTNQEGKE